MFNLLVLPRVVFLCPNECLGVHFLTMTLVADMQYTADWKCCATFLVATPTQSPPIMVGVHRLHSLPSNPTNHVHMAHHLPTGLVPGVSPRFDLHHGQANGAHTFCFSAPPPLPFFIAPSQCCIAGNWLLPRRSLRSRSHPSPLPGASAVTKALLYRAPIPWVKAALCAYAAFGPVQIFKVCPFRSPKSRLAFVVPVLWP